MTAGERIDAAYDAFFQIAERTRRWRIDEDLPWELADDRPRDAALVRTALMYCGLELWLPDYTAAGVNLTRERFGQAWFTAAWAYEESKHALVLERYLLRTGQRTPAEIRAARAEMLAHPWSAPFHTPREMTFYGALQETTTLISYVHQERAARRAGDTLLSAIYRKIARDEAAHATFYVEASRALLEEDPEGARADLAHVVRHFVMPGPGLPGWDAHVEALRAQGLDRDVYLRHVLLPTLRRLGVPRRELLRAGRPAAAG